MVKAGDEIVNPRTGQRMVFLKTGTETGGELLQIDSYNPPNAPLEPEHVHPSKRAVPKSSPVRSVSASGARRDRLRRGSP